jgi:hypothetical protein
MVDWILLGSGQSIRGRMFVVSTRSLSADAPYSWQERHVIVKFVTSVCMKTNLWVGPYGHLSLGM